MRRSSSTAAAAAGLALLCLGCSDTTTPRSLQPIDIALDFCAAETPVWFAYQNAGDATFTRVLPDAEGTFRFSAGPRVAVVFVRQQGTSATTEIIGAANTDLQAISGQACLDDSGVKRVGGTVSGVIGSQLALVSMFFSSAYLTSSQTAYTLTQLADRPLDLVASRVNVSGTTTQTADRVIIRRNQNYVNDATVPVLDFSGPEAFSPATSSVAVSGAVAGESTTLYENFFSQQRTSHLLFYSQLSGDGNVVVPIVPATQTAAGDYHDLFAIANTVDGVSFRGAESYFRNPIAVQSLPLDPDEAPVPTFTTESSTPYVQLRMIEGLGASARYDRAANFLLTQQTRFGTTEVSVTVTDGFYNFSPVRWDVRIPDLGGVDGWQNAWGLQAGAPIDWTVTIYRGRPALLFGSAPSEGEGIQFAGRRSVPAPVRAMRAGVTAPLTRSVLRSR